MTSSTPSLTWAEKSSRCMLQGFPSYLEHTVGAFRGTRCRGMMPLHNSDDAMGEGQRDTQAGKGAGDYQMEEIPTWALLISASSMPVAYSIAYDGDASDRCCDVLTVSTR